jgi:4-amino-4-deoxy-L-arabinose transferase-like glycosyltransferase
MVISGKLLMENTPEHRNSDRAALVGLTVLMLVMTFLAFSPAAVPVIDDWTYVWSVRHLLQTGALRMLEWSAHYPLAQILWGALWSELFGFSFAVLRLSTLMLAWAGLVAFFLTLREMEIGPLPASLGTFVLLCNPVLFMLSHSFMTDVPFVSVTNGALLCYVRWTRQGRTQDLALGSGLAIASFLIRQLGAALALVPVGYLLLMRLVTGERRVLPWPQHFWLLVPFLGLGLTLGWIHAVHGETRLYHEKTQLLRFVWSISGWIYMRELLHVLLHLGLVLWPLAWGIISRLSLRGLAWTAGAMVVLCGLCLWQEGELPQPLGAVLTWDELGMGRTLIAGPLPDRPWLVWPQRLVLGISLSGAVVLVAALVEELWRWKHWIRGPATVLVLNGLCQLLFLEVLWLFYDRYYLPLLPGSTALLVGRLHPTKRVTALILAGGLLWGTIAITGTIDMFRFSVAVSEARMWLLRQGVTPEHIDAGYVLNGWWLYAPSPTSGGGPDPDVPFITSMTPLPYKVANAPDPVYVVVRRVTWPVLWAASDTLYVLEHDAVTEEWGLPSMLPGGRQPTAPKKNWEHW